MRFKFALAAIAVTIVSAPASAATLIDFDVYASGNVSIGGGAYGVIGSAGFTNSDGAGGTNFISRTAATTAVTQEAAKLSSDLRALNGITTLSVINNGAGTLTGTSAGVNVFNITGAQYAGLYSLAFAGPGTGAIVNVSGAQAFSNFVNFDFGSLQTQNVVFNFADATGFSMGGLNLRGTLLAPNAAVSLGGGTVQGQVIANSLSSGGTAIGGTAFTGFAASTAVPEPATWALMLIGFGAIGVVLRRRAKGARIRFA